MNIDEQLRHFQQVKPAPLYRGQRQWTAKCPARHTKPHRITITEDKRRAFYRCFDPACGEAAILAGAALEREAVWYEPAPEKKKKTKGSWLTVEQLAAIKGLDPEFLKGHHVKQHGQGIQFTYLKLDGQPADRHRIRYLNAKVWDTDTPEPRPSPSEPYGSWRLALAREKGRLILVEGESDTLTAWAHDLPALGIPGAGMSGLLRAEHLEGIKSIVIVKEPDSGGPVFVAGLSNRFREIGYTGAAGVIEIPAGLKDLSDLHLKYLDNPADFLEQLQQAIRLEVSLNYDMQSPLPIVYRAPSRSDLSYLLTAGGNADRLIETYGEEIAYLDDAGWHVWTGTRWRQDVGGHLMQRFGKMLVRGMLAEAERLADAGDSDDDDNVEAVVHQDEFVESFFASLLRKWALKCDARAPIQEMIDLSKKDAVKDAKDFDAHPLLFNVMNGTLDLTTGELRPHDKADLLTQLSPVTFDATATAPTWERFIDEIMLARPALVDFLRRLVGYCLTGENKEQQFTTLWGPGENGKSTLLETLRKLFGPDYARQNPPGFLTQKKETGGPNSDVARLRGARFVSCVEPERGAKLVEGLVKHLTGGDTVTSRFLFKEWTETIMIHKTLIATNHLPRIVGVDHATWRRVHLIPFDASFKGRADKEMPVKLAAELPGILNWALRGCREWLEQGLNPPAEVLAAVEEYRRQEDTFGDFLRDYCVFDRKAMVPAGDLYRAYRQWAEDGGEKPMTLMAFGKAVGERNIAKPKAERQGAKVQKVYHGIGLVTAVTHVTDFPEVFGHGGESISKPEEEAISRGLESSGKRVSEVTAVTPDPESSEEPAWEVTITKDTTPGSSVDSVVEIQEDGTESAVPPEIEAALRGLVTWHEQAPVSPGLILVMPDGRVLLEDDPNDPLNDLEETT